MNWYKIAQEEFSRYTDIGHYEYADHINPQQDKKITLWISDITGGNFKMKQISTRSGMIHERMFDLRVNENYWGRHDPFKNAVSITIPSVVPDISIEDIPNRLINRLVSEFPESSIYAYGAFDNTSFTQII